MSRRNERKVARINSTYMNQYDAHIERQRKRNKRLRRRLTLFAIVAFITFGVFFVYHGNQRKIYAEKQAQYEALQAQLIALESEEEALEEEINLLEDESYVLQIAKTNYFFTQEGEIIFKLPEESPTY